MFFKSITNRLIAISERRSPDFIVGTAENPYLKRWHLIPRNGLLNIYLHQFCRDDDDRALHDHPWASLSIVLRGQYIELLSKDRHRVRRAGDVIPRAARTAHRIALFLKRATFRRGQSTAIGCWPLIPSPCWTLFITGPRIREWGFHCPNGWVHWRAFTAPGNEGQIGKGCE